MFFVRQTSFSFLSRKSVWIMNVILSTRWNTRLAWSHIIELTRYSKSFSKRFLLDIALRVCAMSSNFTISVDCYHSILRLNYLLTFIKYYIWDLRKYQVDHSLDYNYEISCECWVTPSMWFTSRAHLSHRLQTFVRRLSDVNIIVKHGNRTLNDQQHLQHKKSKLSCSNVFE